MRKIVVVLILFLSVPVRLKAQVQIIPLLVDSGLFIHDIDFFNPDTVFFVRGQKFIELLMGELIGIQLKPTRHGSEMLIL